MYNTYRMQLHSCQFRCIFGSVSYVYDTETTLYYLQSRYYNPEMGRFINADAIDLLGANGDFASLNLFAYCGNNPVCRKDVTGTLWGAIIGGALAGAFIGAISSIVSSGLNGDEITVDGILTAAVTGAVAGAIGAVGGIVEGARLACSVAVGVISGTVTAFTTEGTMGEKLVAGTAAGVAAGVGTYMGAGIPTLTGSGAVIEGITAFAGTLFSGTQTELFSVPIQRLTRILEAAY